MLISEHGLVKLADFGVSRATDDVQLTRTGVIAGTPAYLAPEVAQGRQPTAASDIFALGATLYTAVEGTPPFGLDENAYALLHKVATVQPEPPRQAGPLAGTVMRLLSVDPEKRPSAAQARDLLAAIAVGHAVAPTGPSACCPPKAPRPGTTHRRRLRWSGRSDPGAHPRCSACSSACWWSWPGRPSSRSRTHRPDAPPHRPPPGVNLFGIVVAAALSLLVGPRFRRRRHAGRALPDG